MPKTTKVKYLELVCAIGSDVFPCNDEVVFCKLCSKAFPNARKFTPSQHVSSAVRKEALLRRGATDDKMRQQLLTSATDGSSRGNFP